MGELDRKKVALAIIFLSWIAIAVLSIAYINVAREEVRGKLTYEKAVSMDKEEILALLQEKKDRAEEMPLSAYLILGIAVAGFAIGAASLWALHGEGKRAKADILLPLFHKEERAVMEVLLRKKEAPQAQIRMETGMNKVRLSRTLKRMEEKGLVEIVKGGKINFVRLGKKVREVVEKLNLN